MAKQVGLTYGDALFELAVEQDKVDDILNEVVALKQILADNDELVKLLNHPKIGKDEKVTLVETVFKGKISDDLLGTVVIMIKKDRQGNILEVLDYYETAVKRYKNIGTAYITSAVNLSDAQKQEIEDKLLDTTSYEKIESLYTIDSSIIGGLIIRIEDRVVDSSIKTKIESLSKALYRW